VMTRTRHRRGAKVIEGSGSVDDFECGAGVVRLVDERSGWASWLSTAIIGTLSEIMRLLISVR
jgi:hypothetical protein